MNAPKTVTLTLEWIEVGGGDADLRLGPMHVGSVYKKRPGHWRAASWFTAIDHVFKHGTREAAMAAIEAIVMEFAL